MTCIVVGRGLMGLVLVAAAACSGGEPDVDAGQSAAAAGRPHTGTDFDDYVRVLERVDRCSEIYRSRYTPENTWFHRLTASMFVVETRRGCGWTGSCGNRVMLIDEGRGRPAVVAGWCARKVARSDKCSVGPGFEMRKRGYQSYPLHIRVCVPGDHAVETELLARGHIPYTVLQQLPFSECSDSDYAFDCYPLRSMELSDVTLADGRRGLEVIAPAGMRLPSDTRYLFATTDGEHFSLVGKR